MLAGPRTSVGYSHEKGTCQLPCMFLPEPKAIERGRAKLTHAHLVVGAKTATTVKLKSDAIEVMALAYRSLHFLS